MKSLPFKTLAPHWPSGLASVIAPRFPWFPDVIAEVHRILLNFDARFSVRPKSNTLDARRPARWHK
jgi:hypothetical protein